MPHLLKMLRYFLNGRAQRIFGLQLLVALAFCLGGRYLWGTYKNDICRQKEYCVDIKDIRVFNPPKWVSNRLIQEALAYRPAEKRDDELNALDAELPQILFTAFSQHPWVKEVEKIVVYYPGKIDVYLQFKTPIAVVDPTQPVVGTFENVAQTPFENENVDNAAPQKNFLNDANPKIDALSVGSFINSKEDSQENVLSNAEKYVVDATGYRLPDDYFQENPNEYYQFLWILGIYSTPMVNHGRCADPLVAEAAQFAEFLVENGVPEKLGVNRIVVSRKPGAGKGTYRLKTKNETVVDWGYFDSSKSSRGKETSAAVAEDVAEPGPKEIKARIFEYQKEKLARLLEVAQKFNSLDAVPSENKGELDLSQY